MTPRARPGPWSTRPSASPASSVSWSRAGRRPIPPSTARASPSRASFPVPPASTITLLAGGVATVAGVFPAVAMKLLDFVGIYGTVLAPVGAILFHQPPLSPGNRASPPTTPRTTGSTMNLAVLLAWLISGGRLPLRLLRHQSSSGPPSWPCPPGSPCGALYLLFNKILLRSQACVNGGRGPLPQTHPLSPRPHRTPTRTSNDHDRRRQSHLLVRPHRPDSCSCSPSSSPPARSMRAR